MPSVTTRLERYLKDEIGDCQPEDVDQRVEELDTLESILSDGEIDREVELFGALANETRYKLVRLLVAANDELCVCELNAMVDASESAISHALATLSDTGLVTRRKDGRWRKYRATNTAVSMVTLLDGIPPETKERDDG